MLHFEKAIGKPERNLISDLFEEEKWRSKAEWIWQLTNDKVDA